MEKEKIEFTKSDPCPYCQGESARCLDTNDFEDGYWTYKSQVLSMARILLCNICHKVFWTAIVKDGNNEAYYKSFKDMDSFKWVKYEYNDNLSDTEREIKRMSDKRRLISSRKHRSLQKQLIKEGKIFYPIFRMEGGSIDTIGDGIRMEDLYGIEGIMEVK